MKRTLGIASVLLILALSNSALALPLSNNNRVLIIPFTALNVPEHQQWIAAAVQETLVTDLGQSPTFSPFAFKTQVVVEDNGTAARLAREVSARYVIRGSVQVVENQIRLTAQMIDVHTLNTVATATVTGSSSDLLRLEDSLADQLRGNHEPSPAGATPVAATSTPPTPSTPSASSATTTTITTAQTAAGTSITIPAGTTVQIIIPPAQTYPNPTYPQPTYSDNYPNGYYDSYPNYSYVAYPVYLSLGQQHSSHGGNWGGHGGNQAGSGQNMVGNGNDHGRISAPCAPIPHGTTTTVQQGMNGNVTTVYHY